MPKRDGAVLIAGPTGSGKSALALRLAEALHSRGGASIINADSQQVYRELRLLTARPTPEQEARVPHRLYGVLDANDPCSAGRWKEMALAAVAAARAEGRLPIMVGGTGLYFRALTQGLTSLPAIPTGVRRAARAKLAELGSPGLHRALERRDPAMAARFAPADSQRVVRAWEVVEATGMSLADWQEGKSGTAVLRGPTLKIVLNLPRKLLYARIDARLAEMVGRGALDELASLAALGLDTRLPAMKALGVGELIGHVRGEVPLEQALQRAQGATRRYAKRQMTWFRHQMAEWRWVAAQDSESFFEKIFPNICQFLLTETK